MPARAIASATVSFGLVSIPVKLYTATESGTTISFNLLHKACGSRLKQQYLCTKDNQVVPREEMVKGYEFAKDQYVMFTPEELKELEEKSTQAIEITEFLPAEKVDPIYFDRAYYIGPDKGGAKAYRLLARAMKQSGRVALAKYAARGRQYLVMLRPADDDRLVMQQLHYADEVRSASDVPLDGADVREQELALAMQLVGQISSDSFRPEAYEDEVRKRTEELIQRKVEGQEITLAPAQPAGAQVIDLLEALKASLAKKAEAPAAVRGKPAAASETVAFPEERKPARRAPREEVKSKAKARKE